MKPEKLITAMGTYVAEGQNIMLHTSTCECGKLMVRSSKQASLNYYTNNEKYHAKCCGSKLTYTGEKLFTGNEIVEPIAIVEIKAVERNFLRSDKEEDFIESVIETPVKKIKKENSKMTNSKMVVALKENIDNPEALTNLFNEHEEIFIDMVQCIKDTMKLKTLAIIQTKYSNARLERKNEKIKHVVLEEIIIPA